MSEHDFDVVVIGGGQAGLAMGYYLREQGLPDAFHAAPLQRAAGPTWPASSVQCGPAAQ
jgi:cation diffusion facilitator CzcD-associated flavoprotein CzcO